MRTNCGTKKATGDIGEPTQHVDVRSITHRSHAFRTEWPRLLKRGAFRYMRPATNNRAFVGRLLNFLLASNL